MLTQQVLNIFKFKSYNRKHSALVNNVKFIISQGVKVGLTAYTINWYELSGKKARDLILLLAMSNYPNSITAGKMAELSYNSFCGVDFKFIYLLNFEIKHFIID